ncbi:hypothetical protein AAKU55_001200 [Oxalobacteraceae bacterium GrIS 1.11]
MGWLKKNKNTSRLGQLLVKKKLISEEQLAQAIARQRSTGQRLGEILAEWNLITQQHVQDALRRQGHLRMAASIASAVLAPIESPAAQALPAVSVAVAALPERALPGLRMLSEDELGATSAQGLNEELIRRVREQVKHAGVVADLARLLDPVLGFLQSDVSMKDVLYDASRVAATLNRDGSLSLRLPSSIGELDFQNIRVRGTDGPSFGSIAIKGINLTGTVITLGFKH